MFSNLKILGVLVFVCFEMRHACVSILVQSRWLEVRRGRGGQHCTWSTPPAAVKTKGGRKQISWLKNTQGFSKGKKISVSAVENWSWDRTDNILLCEKLEPRRRWQLTYLAQPCGEPVASPGADRDTEPPRGDPALALCPARNHLSPV